MGKRGNGSGRTAGSCERQHAGSQILLGQCYPLRKPSSLLKHTPTMHRRRFHRSESSPLEKIRELGSQGYWAIAGHRIQKSSRKCPETPSQWFAESLTSKPRTTAWRVQILRLITAPRIWTLEERTAPLQSRNVFCFMGNNGFGQPFFLSYRSCLGKSSAKNPE
jgi:hypothetical protein